MHIGEDTAAALLTGWTFEKNDRVCKRYKAYTAVEHLSTALVVVFQQVSGESDEQSEHRDAQDTSSLFEAQWKSARKHVNATEHDLLQGTQQRTNVQAKQAHEKLH